MLDLAVRDARIRRNSAVGDKLPRGPVTPRRYLTHQQVAQLADAAGDHRLVVLTLAYCGLRWGELAALRVRAAGIPGLTPTSSATPAPAWPSAPAPTPCVFRKKTCPRTDIRSPVTCSFMEPPM